MFADCVFNRDDGGPFAAKLDAPFGEFITGLGGNWTTLREMEDIDMWLEMADNVLDGLTGPKAHLRSWYECGFQLAMLVNLANYELPPGESEDLDDAWNDAVGAFSGALSELSMEGAVVESVLEMVQSLRTPGQHTDENVSELQNSLQHHAVNADG